ncbi:hypothetical protein AA12717_0276 [Gluconacetobacter sacchari DSM 12717]|uniref:Uncharacterized protein n=2 Tax=Gluconacetobacter sacchari TaxID=92759 RepID=A0A7W4IAL7_9PROT|nr:hypothetical protein [Gluconacetobacter sacchari]MBB2159361.1 hypothetical protein [Gluconacetobacter sacchari]GBQ19511.1 hypothetical protein AA12717_0276 [Gluconacetobacter sacchari DSM 12717]
MIILYAAAFIAWGVWWVRGSIWPALMVVSLLALIERVSYMDQRHLDPPGALAELAIVAACAFIPHLLARRRARQIERTLHGVSFLAVRD